VFEAASGHAEGLIPCLRTWLRGRGRRGRRFCWRQGMEFSEECDSVFDGISGGPLLKDDCVAGGRWGELDFVTTMISADWRVLSTTALHVGGEGELEFADVGGFEGNWEPPDAAAST